MANKKNEHDAADLGRSIKSRFKYEGGENSVSIDDIPLVSDQAKEKIYGEAFRLYNNGKLDRAIELFQLLIIIDSENPKYAMGLGAAQQMKKNYQYAIDSYVQCSLLDPENPIPYFHTADCYIKMENPGSAIINLELAVEHSKSCTRFSKLQERARMTIEALKREMGLPASKKNKKSS